MAGASARAAVSRTLGDPRIARRLTPPIHVVAAGKAASAMITALSESSPIPPATLLAIGTHADDRMPRHIEWHESAHPVPDARSIVAARRALETAAAVPAEGSLILLLSGGASALMALPLDGLTLEHKQHTVRTMMLAGADIHALNTVRKHLSLVKGGRLAAACRGTTVTLAISDVVGDDLSVIGSGPGVADATTWSEARAALQKFGGMAHAPDVTALMERGVHGEVDETPKPGDARLARAEAHVIASRTHALDAAEAAARALGYRVERLDGEVTGEAREAARAWWPRAIACARRGAPVCVLSAGETTVQVTGRGRGGRNQEFALALASEIGAAPGTIIAGSVGTDGIDGPTDAAGALVDATTNARARSLGLSPAAHLADNNAYDFFSHLGDLIHLGRTDTNVGDVQILLVR